MSKQAITEYYNRIDKYQRFGGTRNESSIRRAFANLLEEYCLPKNLILVDELNLKRSPKRPDGTVKSAMQLDYGFWESKDTKDKLDEEIAKKIEIGYPTYNIIFENSEEIVLIQHDEEVMRGSMQDEDFLHRILTAFINYERPEIEDFHKAIEKFKEDIPDIIEALRKLIADQAETNPHFQQARKAFWEICKESINPEISAFDIREMLIQHILTAEIFDTVFGESHFHRENNIARELETVVNTFFSGELRRNTLNAVESYYHAIKAEAARIDDHHEKQKFLKVIYENFYKAYNPKGADRLGVVYTPNEIVKFMVESTDYLLDKHFGKSLANKNVEILDPATGTGTFICDIIEHIPPQYLEYKYKNEIHANELAVLPYYIANLNIEHTYQQKMNKYESFDNIVFVDTLDNFQALKWERMDIDQGQTEELFSVSAENMRRIKEQNKRKLSVIIGNPPYNAKQAWYNDFNPNKKYKRIDDRIKNTYIKYGTAQNQNNVYDMYTRFFRWAADRLDKDGVICFITNNSFLNSRTFDGFRKVVSEEFDYGYFIDLGGNIRELSGKDGIFLGEKHTIFGLSAMVGISISFLIKDSKEQRKKCIIEYIHPCDIRATRREKIDFLLENPLEKIKFNRLVPDKKHNWLNISDNDFDEFIPLIDKSVKAGKSDQAVFKYFSRGLETNRQDWVYDYSLENLTNKLNYTTKVYTEDQKIKKLSQRIKWSRELRKHFEKNIKISFNKNAIQKGFLKPYCLYNVYLDKHLNSFIYDWEKFIYSKNTEKFICIPGLASPKDFHCLSVNKIIDLNSLPAGVQCLPINNYNNKKPTPNITNWGLQQFVSHYQNRKISKEDIFHYTYAVLHNPAYRKKYEINLKRDFPRLPFYKDFYKWVNWGKTLMDLHINYETVEPYPLKVIHEDNVRAIHELHQPRAPKPKLRAIPEDGHIILDENTDITGIPELAWQYKLGNRSALHWILDQHKEKKPKDPTIAEKFNTYRFADYKDQVIDLLKRVCTVSVKTVEIVKQMEIEEPHN